MKFIKNLRLLCGRSRYRLSNQTFCYKLKRPNPTTDSLMLFKETERPNTSSFGHCYRPQGKVMFSQVTVCPQSASWILVHCSALLQRSWYASYWNAFLLNVTNRWISRSHEIITTQNPGWKILFKYSR